MQLQPPVLETPFITNCSRLFLLFNKPEFEPEKCQMPALTIHKLIRIFDVYKIEAPV